MGTLILTGGATVTNKRIKTKVLKILGLLLVATGAYGAEVPYQHCVVPNGGTGPWTAQQMTWPDHMPEAYRYPRPPCCATLPPQPVPGPSVTSPWRTT